MNINIIIAGGGTGGHLFPGIAIAEEFLRRNPLNKILFIGTNNGLEKNIIPDYGFQLETINIGGIKGKGLKSLFSVFKIPISIIQSLKILNKFNPHFVLGVGGYASGPMVFSSFLKNIPCAILEQNIIPGDTNRILSKIVSKIFLSFPDIYGFFKNTPSIVIGNPLRREFIFHNIKYRYKKNKINKYFTILVLGGSQGSHHLNLIILETLNYLEDIFSKIKIIHQTGQNDFSFIREKYKNFFLKGLSTKTFSFIKNIKDAYNIANLIICRAGATSIAEITACGKAAIYVPFPFASRDHQTKNAKFLASAGAAKMFSQVGLSGKILAETIKKLFFNKKKIYFMEQASLKLSYPDATFKIVNECINIIQR